MGKAKKPFIDRKNAVTFHLVHRSQHDPLVTDETAPQHVIVEGESRQKCKHDKTEGGDKRVEQKKFGIYFDDDYDYLQHLKKVENNTVWEFVRNPNQTLKNIDDDNVPKLNLPSSVFATEFEEEVGMLNKAAPHPGPCLDWDPDVVAALDDNFINNEELEDDFVMQAMGGTKKDEDNDVQYKFEKDYGSSNLVGHLSDADELMDHLGPLLRERRFIEQQDDVKSCFTEYSMSSSVIHRNEQLTLLDERFEHFFATYDDQKIGDLPMDNIEGIWHQKHPYLVGCLKELKKSNKILEYNKDWDRERLNKYRNIDENGNDSNEELDEREIKDQKEQKWDCETILTTYSNIYNRPKIIDEPRKSNSSSTIRSNSQQKIEINPKTGLPTNVLRIGAGTQLTAKALAKLDEEAATNNKDTAGSKTLCAKSILSTLSVLSIRPKDETPEEKCHRKRLLKKYRNERRFERKSNADAFKKEKKRQTQIKINQQQNQQGTKIL